MTTPLTPVASATSMVPFFRPQAVAIVGASRDPDSIGQRILTGLLQAGFRGPVYPVNPQAQTIAGLPAYPSLRAVPGPVDLAVIVVPAPRVLEVVDDCAAHGVRAIVVISAGFAEVGGEGVARQAALVAKVRAAGLRMIGPNCLGLLNTDPAVRLNASFAPFFPPAGRVAMSSQSGAVGLAALCAAPRYGIGFSTFVSVGNKADVSGNDLLGYWETDPHTDVILLYLESFGNPRRFSPIARRVGRRKPIVVLHSGLTRAGGRAAGSHTAALATNAVAADALFRQTGVVRAATLEDMFHLALAFSCQKPPQGPRVAIVTNAGGPGILSADACEASGLSVPEASAALQAHLRQRLPSAASVRNPIDLIAAAKPDAYHHAIAAMLTSGEYDALVVLHTDVGLAPVAEVEGAIAAGLTAARHAGVTEAPVLACVLSHEPHSPHIDCGQERIPCYPFPEIPGRVLGQLAAYGRWRAQAPGEDRSFPDSDFLTAQRIGQQNAHRGGGWLAADDVRTLLRAAGLKLAPDVFARTADEAAAAAARLGFPVAVKLASRRFVHKSEVGGVKLGLSDEAAVRHAFTEIRQAVERTGAAEAMDGVLVQPMLRRGVEVMAGVTQDPLFGPLIAFGLGGIYVEVLADVVFRVAPLTDRDAQDMVRGIRGFRLLEGYRGHPPADLAALEETLLRLSRLAEQVPEITEIDLNPIFVYPPGEGYCIADARVRVRSAW
ncbi:MAG: acetate--CoA ligase family protein [Gemmataceae bacterium]|nr:acetate--CoA ligase family protein [Gemmata sp.]MDW8196851.1 acetate--CoA ligase family protein [Gemmataceae bacterium]